MKKFFLCVFICMVCIANVTYGKQPDFSGISAENSCIDYVLEPPFLTSSAPPMVMLVMGKNHKLFYEAYNDASDIDNDGQIDVGYDPSIDYYGYFDSYKCYTYTNNRFEPSSVSPDKTCNGTNEWSGDFLNYLTMSRMDSLRKVFYGGKRSTDTSEETVLERAYVPQDAHSWGKEYNSLSEDGYAIEDYTPLSAPEAGKRHLFACTTLSADGAPLLRYVTNSEARIWEWVSKNKPVAGSGLSTGDSVSPTDRNVRVQVCDPNMPESNCKQYPDGTWKPIGILQRYGESDRIYFGLISGSYEKNLSGGVLRKKISSITDEVNNATGQFTTGANGIIHSMDHFQISGFDYSDHDYDNEQGGDAWVTTRAMHEGEFPDWGNPVAEMMYEGLRYFSGAEGASSEFDISGISESIDTDLGLSTDSWDDPYAGHPWCAKPIMLVISDIYPNYDTDQLPGSAFTQSSGEVLGNATLNVANLAATISSHEGVNGTYFLGDNNSVADSTCSAKSVQDLADARGLCPEEPTKEGGYYAASVAYYGKKNDIHTTAGNVQSVQTYSVALSSPLPSIEIDVGGNMVSLVPFGKSVGGSGYDISNATDEFQPTNAIMDYYVESINATSGSFRINFEDVEQGADHDMDAIVRYQYQLLDEYNGTVSDPAQADKLSVTVTSEYAAGSIIQHLGYIISGTTQDGSYLVVRDEDTAQDEDVAYFLDDPNTSSALPLSDQRIFEPSGSDSAQLLKNPLWYAAKWGGFRDSNADNVPQTREWDQNQDGEPDNYFYVHNPLRLEEQLNQAFTSILKRLSAGSAASVVSGSRSGEGALYQAVFWPTQIDETTGSEISWTGDVHAILVDSFGDLFEDTNQNNRYDANDEQIHLYYDEGSDHSMACVGGNVVNGSCSVQPKELDEINYLWSAAEWLNTDPDTDPLDIEHNRPSYSNWTTSKRYLFSWFDENEDGVVNGTGTMTSSEVYAFTANTGGILDSGAGAFLNASVVNWIRGKDQDGLRNREVNGETWRLGDVVHSTPVAVGAPAENYDLYWGDSSYSEFYRQYRDRRLMIYFGGNDGILHAVNGGFYSRTDKAFYTGYDSANDEYSNATRPELGAEMWGYVPYNLLPQLQCLTEPGYEHKYYVDLHPRVFDVRIFDDDATHPGGWGTILVAGMRFGGGHVVENGRDFSSSYMIFDITDPESPPELLGEITYDYEAQNPNDVAELGYTLSVPTVVPTKPAVGDQRWFLILGSGPDAQNITVTDASSSRKARLVVIPLHELAQGGFSLQIPDEAPKDADTAGVLDSSFSDAFVGSDFVAVDYDFDFLTDILYFGVISGSSGDWGGGVSRLKVEDYPDPSNWIIKLMMDARKPVTGAPNIGWKDGSVWVYFGTGRFLTSDDSRDTSTNYYFGIKEPKKTDSDAYNFNEVNKPTYDNPNLNDWIKSSDIQVEAGSGILSCQGGGTECLPDDVSTFQELENYLITTASNGWFRELNATEKIIGQSTLLGGLVNYTTYSPSPNLCSSEGTSALYSVYYLTGTPWEEDVFGDGGGETYVKFRKNLGRGMSITPTMHLGSQEGGKIVVQTSTGEIQEIDQPNLPLTNVYSGPAGWHTHDIED